MTYDGDKYALEAQNTVTLVARILHQYAIRGGFVSVAGLATAINFTALARTPP